MAVIHYLHFSRSLRKVSSIYGASPASLSRWVRKHAEGITVSPKQRRPRQSFVVQSAINSIIARDAFQTLHDIVYALKNRNIFVSRSTVQRYLCRDGYSRKRAVHRFSPKEPSPLDARRFLDEMQTAKEVISIDETSVVLERKPLYGYTLKGTRAVYRSKKPFRGNRVTLLLAISNIRGVIAYRTFSGSCNRDRFAAFIREDVIAPGATVTLDNVRFHHSVIVKHAAEAVGLRLVFTPPYSPDFNFIENAFSVIKSHTRKFDASEHLKAAIALVTPSKAVSLYHHMLRCVSKIAVNA